MPHPLIVSSSAELANETAFEAGLISARRQNMVKALRQRAAVLDLDPKASAEDRAAMAALVDIAKQRLSLPTSDDGYLAANRERQRRWRERHKASMEE